MKRLFVAVVREEGDRLVAVDGFSDRPALPLAARATPGDVVLCRARGDVAEVEKILAGAGSALAKIYSIAQELGLDPSFDDDVEAEVAAWEARPDIDDPSLLDMVALPFVTIDGAGSKDLDQALYIERADDGFRVYYALADASHFAPPGSAIWEQALRRGASYYFPGFSVPMLPRALSEGLVSLNPDVTRRALVFVMLLDADGRVQETDVVRARVKSRHKMTFDQAEVLNKRPEESPFREASFRESLSLLPLVGDRRRALAAGRNVVRYRRREVDISIDGTGLSFVMLEGERLDVEGDNEQISLLVNECAAHLLLEARRPNLEPIYRVHAAPDEERLAALAALTEAMTALHGLDPARWVWNRAEQGLSAYLRGLPEAGDPGVEPRLERIGRAIERQAVMVNSRSTFATSPGQHFGVGAEIYARFSAPMREIVGVFVHKELVELMAGKTHGDEALRTRVVEAANRSKDVQRSVNDRVNRLVLDAMFERDASVPRAERPRRRGTVMGITSGKVHVQLDDPGVDVKLYVRDIGRKLDGAWLNVEGGGTALTRREGGGVVLRLGDEIDVLVDSRDASQDRWVLLPELATR